MSITIGSIVGNWKVISDKYKKDRIYWNDCECICGKTKSVRHWHLNNYKTFGCGCSNVKGRFKSKTFGDLPLAYYNSFKNKRIRKGIHFSEDITPEFLWDLFLKQQSKCAISGVDIKFNKKWSHQHESSSKIELQTASLDRIDSQLGYTINNVQWVHKDINYMKGSMSQDTFLIYCRNIVEYNNNKCFGSNNN